ncbi:hypothetical protein ACFE04_019018 [Oxalis oulophora]
MRYMRIRRLEEEDDYEPALTENGPDSPSSAEDSRLSSIQAPSPKKRKSAHKKVVSVLIGDVDGSKSKGETYPPSDSWAWRKYGQKPIKGSPYPRGYYRCSSSKGCPARKQVERNRVDPTMLVITYAAEHNHSLPTTTKQHRHAAVLAPPKIQEEEDDSRGDEEEEEEEEKEQEEDHVQLLQQQPIVKLEHEEHQQQQQQQQQQDVLAWQGNIELYDGYEFGWYDDVAVTSSVLEDSAATMSSGGCCSSSSTMTTDADMTMMFKMREEDELLFADLGELPECSMVFQRNVVEPEEKNRTCNFSAVSCSST